MENETHYIEVNSFKEEYKLTPNDISFQMPIISIKTYEEDMKFSNQLLTIKTIAIFKIKLKQNDTNQN
jgi:hypothetical protein